MNTFVCYRRLRRAILAGLCCLGVGIGGCLDSDLFKRFREAYGPGAMQGLTAAVTNPDDAETGLRQAITALFDGLGAVIQPRTASSNGSSNSSGSSSSNSSSSSASSSSSTSGGSSG